MSKMEHMSESVVGKIIFPIVDALQYMHMTGVTHRDLRPENILVNAAGDFE
jgi:serine/threonine protein kinase